MQTYLREYRSEGGKLSVVQYEILECLGPSYDKRGWFFRVWASNQLEAQLMFWPSSSSDLVKDIRILCLDEVH